MRLSSWLRFARSLFFFVPDGVEKSRRPARLRKPATTAPLTSLERLEDRTVPTTFTVGNLADSGLGSLRAAIADANATPGADVIRFDNIGGGIDFHRWPETPDGHSLFWAGMNKGKRSLAVDVRSPEGQELVTALITAPGPDRGVFLSNSASRRPNSAASLASLRSPLASCCPPPGKCACES